MLEVFNSNGKVSVLAFGSAIRGYNKLHMYRSTIVAFGKVTVLAFGSAIRGYNKLHMYRSTIVAFGKMRSTGVVPDSECSCHIMEAYMRLGDSEKEVEFFL